MKLGKFPSQQKGVQDRMNFDALFIFDRKIEVTAMRLKWLSVLLILLWNLIPLSVFADEIETRASINDRMNELKLMSEDEAINLCSDSFFDAFPLANETDKQAAERYYDEVSWLSLQIFETPFNQLNVDQIKEFLEEPRLLALSDRLLSGLFQEPEIDGCLYQGTTAYDRPMTENAGYRFQGHMALYFRVDGNADCYSKWCATDTWGSDCGNGKIPFWSLLCKAPGCEWYPWNGKYVKDVVMLVPHSWWYAPQFWLVPASTKAAWFSISWRSSQIQGCCDPGCR